MKDVRLFCAKSRGLCCINRYSCRPLTVTMLSTVCLFMIVGVVLTDAGVVMQQPSLKSSVRSLHVRSIPAVQGFSSNVYEIHMQPYSFDLHPLMAGVDLRPHEADDSKGVRGMLMFLQIHPPSGPVQITGNITGLSKGHHGFHVHEYGDMRKGCASAGPHYNPHMLPHGGPIDAFRHIGDLGNIEVGDDGVAKVEIWDHMISLTGTHSILGRSIVVHEKQDDLGRGGDMDSMMTGSAGARLACGVVGYMEPETMMPMNPEMTPMAPSWPNAHWNPFGHNMGPVGHMGPMGSMGPMGHMGPMGPMGQYPGMQPPAKDSGSDMTGGKAKENSEVETVDSFGMG